MSLDKILSISGKPGLYELKAQTRSGFVAEALADGKKLSVSMRHNVSILSEIAIYTYTEEVPLRDIFKRIQDKENKGAAINHKVSKNELESYFGEVLPDYDVDRVYTSDMKKVIQWYNILQAKGITDFEAPDEKKSSDEEE
ncbi:hypothetical protein GCM10022393_22130 [Aquimarina addita]|uniref:DUF5606 domain-containing protein n=1 Tax=Aquimarina addita TaxID=870485 RepID=A0ABP6UIZ5_9FLAO